MTLPSYNTLDLELLGGWLSVWFNEPERRNPLTPARQDDILALCAWLSGTDIRGVVFRGRGGMFCAGGDLKAFQQAIAGELDNTQFVQDSLKVASIFDAVAGLKQYTVAVIEGAAMAGGLGLTCCCDHTIVETNAKLGLSEVRIGLVPAQIAPFVIRRLGIHKAKRLMLTGEVLSGRQAADIGLADDVVTSEGINSVLAALEKALSFAAPEALAAIKEQVAILPYQTRAQQREIAANIFADSMMSDETNEGLSAFFDKRKPSWVGQ